MAPRVPRVQKRLGEVVLKMGLRDEALVFLRRTVELDPGRSREIIDLLASQFFSLDEIVCHERLGGLLKHYQRKAA